MKQLDAFEERDFTEQVSILDSLVKGKRYESIPEIISIFNKIPKHEAIRLVIRDTLKKLFSSNEKCTISFLSPENHEIQSICMETAGQKRFNSATKVLKSMAEQAYEKKENGILFELILALFRIQPYESIDLFRKCIFHQDPLISSRCIEIIGDLNDSSSFDHLCNIINHAELENGECDLPTASAVAALNKLQENDALLYLVSKLHHKNPGVRRVIHYELSRRENEPINALNAVFEREDVDSKIFAANILGLIGTKKACDVLVNALGKDLSSYPNIRFAIYEALGKIGDMTGLVYLVDGLKETDQMALMAVVSSLDPHLNPWILKTIIDILHAHDGRDIMLFKAIISSAALNIFEALYIADDKIASSLIEEIKQSKDDKLISQYRKKLMKIKLDRAVSDANSLNSISKIGGLHLLAVDDSKSMLNFYRSFAASMGLSITTAMNGKEALDTISAGENFHLIITDMNMPVMDGIEFTRQVCCNSALKGIPILMITTESERSQEDLAKRAGATHFIQKPFSTEKLLRWIKSYI